jgi:hypothetical protein
VPPGKLSKRVIGDRLAWLEKMVAEIGALPLDSYEGFPANKRDVRAAESCLRRALEAIFEKLYEICRDDLDDPLKIRNAFLKWVKKNPDQIDETL